MSFVSILLATMLAMAHAESSSSVVNLLLQDIGGISGVNYEASFINSDSESSTYWVACAATVPETLCPFDPAGSPGSFSGMTVTQGVQGVLATFDQPGWAFSNSCSFTATTVTALNCTESWSINAGPYGMHNNTGAPHVATGVISWDAAVPSDSWTPLQYGAPPFIPVSITAGLKAVTSGTGSSLPSSTTSVTGSGSKSKTATITTGPTVTGSSTSGASTSTSSSVSKSDGISSPRSSIWMLGAAFLTAALASTNL